MGTKIEDTGSMGSWGEDENRLHIGDEEEVHHEEQEQGSPVEAPEDDEELRAQIEEFVNQYGLNEQSQTILETVHPVVSRKIIKSFTCDKKKPPYDDEFDHFAKSLITQQFVDAWKLDRICHDYLNSLPKEITYNIISEFDPNSGSGDLNKKFMAFAKMMSMHKPPKETGLSKPVAKSSPRRSSIHTPDDKSNRFFKKWNLTEDCQGLFQSLTPSMQESVMKEFDPKRGAYPNEKFRSFCLSRGARFPSKVERPLRFTDRFTERTVKKENVEDFWGEAEKEAEKYDAKREKPKLAPVVPPRRDEVVTKPPIKPVESKPFSEFGAIVTDRELDSMTADFVKRWSIESRGETLLYELPRACRYQVLKDFNGGRKDTKAEYNLISFIKSRSSMVGREKIFIDRYRLDRSAQDFFYSTKLADTDRVKVMENFLPSESVENVNPIFMRYVKSVLNQSFKDRTKSFTGPVGPPPPSKIMGTSRYDTSGVGSTYSSFLKKWNLSSEAVPYLEKYRRSTQSRLMDEFWAKDTSTDVMPLFVSFVRKRGPRYDIERPRTPLPKSRDLERVVPRVSLRESRRSEPVRSEPVRRDRRPSRSRKRERTPPRRALEPPRKIAKPSSDQLSLILKFVKRNKLNASAEETLKAMTQFDQNLIIAHYDPDDGPNVNDVFFNLVRSKCPKATIMSARRMGR